MTEVPAKRVIVTEHARLRARERFPALRGRSDRYLNSVLTAIAFQGPLYGESVVVGHEYRHGSHGPARDVVICVRPDQDDPTKLMVVTALTEAEVKRAGPFRPGSQIT